MVERGKTEAMVAKCRKTRREIGISSEEEGNYESDIENKIDPN